LDPDSARTRRPVRLRPLLPRDSLPLYRLTLSESQYFRHRYRGATPSFDEFQRDLYRDVLAQFIVERRSPPPAALGLVSAHGFNAKNGIAYLSVMAFPRAQRSGLVCFGIELFVEHLFRCWPIRKLFVEIVEMNLPQFLSARGLIFQEEGRLTAFEYYNEAYWDLIIGSITREGWEHTRSQLEELATTRSMHLLKTDAVDPDEFLTELASLLASIKPSVGTFDLNSRFVDDLDFHSLDMLQLLDMMEHLFTDGFDETSITAQFSVRDCYLAYLQALQSPGAADV